MTYSQHYCTKCRKYFSAALSDLAPPGGQYTHRVIDLAVRLVVEDGLPYRPVSWHLWRDHRVGKASASPETLKECEKLTAVENLTPFKDVG